jgi:hypothetical protein
MKCIGSKLNQRLWLILALLTFSLGTPVASQAAFIIEVGNATIPHGGTGTLNVSIRSDGVSDNLYAFGFGIRITSNQGTVLEFQPAQSHAELNDMSYVFALSGSANIDGPPSGTVGPAIDYVGFDTSNDSNGVNVSLTPSLLAVLDLTTLTGTPPNFGDTFSVSIVGTYADMGDDTFFLNSAFDDVNFISLPGTVTISGVAPVPEPSSLILTVGAMACVGIFRRRKQALPLRTI